MIDYTDAQAIERQNMSPNAGCTIDGEFYDVRNLLHSIARLTAALEDVSARNRQLLADHSQLFQRAEKAEAERDTDRAETAMAFGVAANYMDTRHRGDLPSHLISEDGCAIRSLTPAHATAALAARDKAKVIEGLVIARNAAMERYNDNGEGYGIVNAILAKIKEAE